MLLRQHRRLPSLDVFRGLVIACMLLVNGLPDFSEAYPILLHSPWEGITLADFVMPGFIFAMGTAGALHLAKYGRNRENDIFGRITRRSLILILLGLFLSQMPLILQHFFSPGAASSGLLAQIIDHGRVLGVLQRLGLVYFCGMILAWGLERNSLLNTMAFLLLLLSSVCFHLYDTSSPFSPTDNISMVIDGIFPGAAHCYMGGNFDPEGLYGTIAATASMLFGIMAGRHLTVDNAPVFERGGKMILHGGVLLLAGGLWSYMDIICKNLWTAPFALLTSGFCMWLLALLEISFSFMPDFMGWLCAPWRWLGKNALLFYILPEVVLMTLWHVQTVSGTPLYPWLWSVTLKGIGNVPLSILLFTLLWIGLWLPLAKYLHKHDILFKV